MLRRNILLLSILIISADAFGAIVETFDQPGNDVSLSSFPVVYTPGGATYLRDTLDGITSAPSNPAFLPINIGGDKELRFFENLNINIAATGGYAFTNEIYSNASIDAYIGMNGMVGPAYVIGGVMLNVSGSSIPTINGYEATITVYANNPTQASFGFSRVENGISTGINYGGYQPFIVDLKNENYHLNFVVQNGTLTASLWRVLGLGGSIVEQPIDLQTFSGIQNTITVDDLGPFILNPNFDPTDPNSRSHIRNPDYKRFSSGMAGMTAFARNGSEVYFDNVSISVVPIPSAALLLMSGLVSLGALLRRNPTRCI